MLFGRCIEAGGIEFWSRLNNVPVTYPLSTRRHPKIPFLFATPDAQISPEEGLEFKSMSWQLAREIDELGLAAACPHYLLQAQQQMAVMDWRRVRLVGLGDRKLREWPIERNDRLIRLMIERETVFWQHVERRQPPAIDFTRPNSLRAVRHLFPTSTGTTIPLDAATSAQWADYERAGREIAELAEQRERCKAAVLLAIGEHGAGVLEGGQRMVRRKLIQRTGYSVAPTEFWDVRAVACKGLPALAAAEVPDSGSRPGRSRRGRRRPTTNSRSHRKH
jgi:predicted phage-related endonuclease